MSHTLPRPSLLGLLLAATFIPAAALAQHEHHGSLERLGRVAFPTSCAASVQPRFERAMALLHSFWWEQAKDAFTQVAEADPTCAMAHWGLALTYWNNPFAGGPSGADLEAGAGAAARATELGAPTERERDYIAAVAELYRDHSVVRNADRLREYSERMRLVHERHPTDHEAALYYALALIAVASPTDTTLALQKRANEILSQFFEKQPDHPGIAHYIIHANDSPALAQYGLAAARRYAEIAPSVPHAQHMPSHIFIRLGMWEDNIASNQRSYEAGAAYAREHFGDALGAHEFHAMDYVVYGYLQLGRDADAERIAREAVGWKVVPPGTLVSEYARAAMPARLLLERDAWEEAARLEILTEGLPIPTVITRFARGVGAARSGDAAAARAEAAELARLEDALTEAGNTYWASIAGIKRRAVEAWAAYAAGDVEAGLSMAAAAADIEDATDKHPVTPGEILPARELYADMLLGAGRHAEARAAYESTLKREPNRARALFGAATAARLAGDPAGAQALYERYLGLMEKGDGARPGIAAARAAVGGG